MRNLIEPWADVVTSEEEVVEGPDSRSGEGMTFEGRHVSVADTVVIRARTEATHVEEFLGIAPTGRRIWWDSVTLAWVKDGRVVGQWAAPDLCWFIRTSRISGIGVSRLKPAIEARV